MGIAPAASKSTFSIAALGRNFNFGARRLARGGRGDLCGLAAFEHPHHRAQDGSLYHERRRTTSDERRTHYQRIHFSSLTLFDARLVPSVSELSQRLLNKHIVHNSAPHHGWRPYFVLPAVEELTVDDGLTANSANRLYLLDKHQRDGGFGANACMPIQRCARIPGLRVRGPTQIAHLTPASSRHDHRKYPQQPDKLFPFAQLFPVS